MTHARVFLVGAALITLVLAYVACGSREIGTPTSPTLIDVVRSPRDEAPAIDVDNPGEVANPQPVAPTAVLIGAGDLSQ